MALTNEQKEFLKSYLPEDEQFTTNEEIYEVASALGIIAMEVKSLIELRNDVVRFYVELKKGEMTFKEGSDRPIRSDKYWDYDVAMMSVTAVIDHYRFEHSGVYPV